MSERWFEGSDSFPCRIIKDSDYYDSFFNLYLKNKQILLDENNKPFEQFFKDCELDATLIEKHFVISDMISKGINSGISMENIRNTYGQIIQVLEDDYCFNVEKAFNLSDEELVKYIDKCPELELGRRYQFTFKEDEMEEIYLGIIDGISIDDILSTYCKYEILDSSFDEINYSFKYKEPVSLYSSKEMSQARIALKEGLTVDQVNFFLQKEKDIYGKSYSIFNTTQMKAISKCFKNGLTFEEVNDILAFKEVYIDGSVKKVCICTEEEIFELAVLIKKEKVA